MSESKGSYQAVEEQLEEVLRRVKEMGSTAASEGKSYWEAQCAKYRSEARERADTIAELREQLEVARSNSISYQNELEKLKVHYKYMEEGALKVMEDAKLGALVRRMPSESSLRRQSANCWRYRDISGNVDNISPELCLSDMEAVGESMTEPYVGGNEREEFLMGQIEKRLPYAAREIATIISDLREKLEADAKLVALVRQMREREAS